MNNKHIACGVVAILIVCLVQFTLWVQNSRTKMQNQASAAQQAEVAASTQLKRERAQLAELRNQSKNLIEFLGIWQPYFESINTAQSAEVNFTIRVKESNLVNLAQRFEQAGIKGNSSVPTVMRAYLTFEDDYSKLLNWLGELETKMPTLRVSNVRLLKGTRANDLRMELILEHPLMNK